MYTFGSLFHKFDVFFSEIVREGGVAPVPAQLRAQLNKQRGNKVIK